MFFLGNTLYYLLLWCCTICITLFFCDHSVFPLPPLWRNTLTLTVCLAIHAMTALLIITDFNIFPAATSSCCPRFALAPQTRLGRCRHWPQLTLQPQRTAANTCCVALFHGDTVSANRKWHANWTASTITQRAFWFPLTSSSICTV